MFDLLGISAAVLCLIHCLLFPVLMLIPFGFAHDAYIDLGFLLIGTAVVYNVTRNISSKSLKIAFWLAIGLISISVLLHLLFHIHSPLIYVGAVVLITAHLINFKNHRHGPSRS
ncbi:MerC domain-containing protein [Niabella yanshanensis]|uniref:MerC domain-containing protein n=1 Tax=Niabella yanshanensis TaxID=577386 RepID=UPI0037423F1B